MTIAQSKILEALTGKTTLHSISAEELDSIAKTYPYFTAAQYFLAKKLMQESDALAAKRQAQKTAVYYNNIYWLNHLLNTPEEPASEKIDVTTETPVQEDIIITAPPAEETLPEPEQVHQAEEPAQPTTEFEVNKAAFAEHLLADADEAGADDTGETEEIVPEEEINPGLARVLAQQAAEFEKPVEEDAKLPIQSEPYYTVDYFDSQGIRLDPSQVPKDKLGKKVRKFTDWLKDMKKVGPQPTDLGTDPEMEQAIQTIANASNETKEIVTESMAEVLIKQGKTAKAIKLYEKLSFLNPDKTAYFAAKISELKGIS
ncbi:hypothetical protein [Foetidibacter luteolus]|uniref:hypothetical protein n=1 Tax=Foetidibacter luteolus TaxID=2608880 RepID=UPI00129B30C2|nr:hypothetical protein [Foetidibacter luteolus]